MNNLLFSSEKNQKINAEKRMNINLQKKESSNK